MGYHLELGSVISHPFSLILMEDHKLSKILFIGATYSLVKVESTSVIGFLFLIRILPCKRKLCAFVNLSGSLGISKENGPVVLGVDKGLNICETIFFTPTSYSVLPNRSKFESTNSSFSTLSPPIPDV